MQVRKTATQQQINTIIIIIANSHIIIKNKYTHSHKVSWVPKTKIINTHRSVWMAYVWGGGGDQSPTFLHKISEKCLNSRLWRHIVSLSKHTWTEPVWFCGSGSGSSSSESFLLNTECNTTLDLWPFKNDVSWAVKAALVHRFVPTRACSTTFS